MPREEAHRFQSARLGVPIRAAIEKGSRSIAVLPFRNLSADPAQAYFCEGMAEEIIHALTKIEGLQVASRTSSFRFLGPPQDIREIGAALNVTTILAGSVRTAGNRLRVVAELTNVGDGYHVWSERYERELQDVFAIQDDIVGNIVAALRARLGRSAVPSTARRHGTNVAAYDRYLRGLSYWYRREQDSIQQATYWFEQALQQDPNYALAHAGVATSYASLGWYGALRPSEVREKARTAVASALRLDDTLAEAHAANGLCRLWLEWDWPGAERALRTALDPEPAHTRALCWLVFLRRAQGRFDEACTIAGEALAIEPVSPYVSAVLGGALMLARRNTEALAELGRAREIAPDSLHALWLSGLALVRSGLHDEAVATLERAATLANSGAYYVALLGWAYGMSGRRDLAEQTLAELRVRATHDYIAPALLSWVLGGLGRLDEAFEFIDRAFEERSALLSAPVEPMYDVLRNDPRFDRLLQRMEFA